MEVRAERPDGAAESVDFDSFFREQFAGVARAAALVARDLWAGQDLAQEAFVRLHPRWREMESLEHARNFLYRVAINLARSQLRRRLRLRRLRLSGREETDSAPDPLARTLDWMEVSEALAELSSRQRACVVMVDYVDMDPAAAASILGIRAETVRVHVMRGRRALRERLGRPRPEEEE